MSRDGLPTGSGTAPPERDVADPHPATEEHHDRQKAPAALGPLELILGPTVASMTAPLRPNRAMSKTTKDPVDSGGPPPV